jgi:hypothetical protein
MSIRSQVLRSVRFSTLMLAVALPGLMVACSETEDEGGRGFATPSQADGGGSANNNGSATEPAGDAGAKSETCNPYDKVNCAPTTVGTTEDDNTANAPAADGGSSATTPATDGGASARSCAAVNSCEAPANAGELSGDLNAESIVLQGSGSKWFSVRVREDSYLGYYTKFSAQLVSPPGTDYNVRLYMNKDEDKIECARETSSSTRSDDSLDSISETWGYSFYNDSRTINVFVEHKNGSCARDLQWTLTLLGNR